MWRCLLASFAAWPGSSAGAYLPQPSIVVGTRAEQAQWLEGGVLESQLKGTCCLKVLLGTLSHKVHLQAFPGCLLDLCLIPKPWEQPCYLHMCRDLLLPLLPLKKSGLVGWRWGGLHCFSEPKWVMAVLLPTAPGTLNYLI